MSIFFLYWFEQFKSSIRSKWQLTCSARSKLAWLIFHSHGTKLHKNIVVYIHVINNERKKWNQVSPCDPCWNKIENARVFFFIYRFLWCFSIFYRILTDFQLDFEFFSFGFILYDRCWDFFLWFYFCILTSILSDSLYFHSLIKK
jgi:hypothetical protein